MVSFDKIRPVADIKLQELERQRSRLAAHYDAVVAEADSKSSLPEKINVLQKGLSAAVFYDSPLHPVYNNLKNLLGRIQNGDTTISEDTMKWWEERMRKDIAKGRRRADYARLFGRILAEWFDANSDGQESADRAPDDSEWDLEDLGDNDTEREIFLEKLAMMAEPVPESSYDLDVVDQVFEGMEAELAKLRRSVDDFADGSATSKVDTEELRSAANAVLANDLVSRPTRLMIRDIESSDDLCNEYAGCATIILDRLEEWDWNRSKPKKMRVNKNRAGKLRAFVDEDVLTALVLQIIGTRWCIAMRSILKNFWASIVSKYTDEPPTRPHVSGTVYHTRAYHRDRLFLAVMPRNREEAATRGYDRNNDKTESPRDRLLDLVAAELQLVKLKGARRKVNTVVAADVKNFGPSLSHSLILAFLTKIGVPSTWLTFFERFLTPTVLFDSVTGPRVLRRGVPPAHALSHFFTELISMGLEAMVFKKTKGHVFLHRVMDDMYLWHHEPRMINLAWRTLRGYLNKCGLELNLSKCGSVQVPGADYDSSKNRDDSVPSDLPVGPVQWSALTLRESGQWLPDDAKVDAQLALLNGELAKSRTVLGAVNVFNSRVRGLEQALGRPSTALGLAHLDAVMKAQNRLRADAAGPGGILAFLERRIAATFLKGDPLSAEMEKEGLPGEIDRLLQLAMDANLTRTQPEAWFYWPILAGGLAVASPLVSLASLRQVVRLNRSCLEDSVPKSQFHDDESVFNVSNSEGEWGRSNGEWLEEEGENADAESEGDKDSQSDDESVQNQENRDLYFDIRTTPEWEYKSVIVGREYAEMLSPLRISSPESTDDFRALLSKFLNRGGEVRGQRQTKLGPHWQWILVTYGEQVMEMLGSLGFAEAKLIPAVLIAHLRGWGSEEGV
ncbi:hypothetical protein HDU93_000449 [Gonapodya sp. JEL0774]|nr:hypothetical protein HDU93_000449 [Gonapodya sp. JEL0774]